MRNVRYVPEVDLGVDFGKRRVSILLPYAVGLLRTRRKRPNRTASGPLARITPLSSNVRYWGCRAAEHCDELAPPHCRPLRLKLL
jgi:hypothetical protein